MRLDFIKNTKRNMVAAFANSGIKLLFPFLNQSRKPLQTFKAAASLWHQDRWKPIVSSVFNLAMSFAAVLLLPDAYKLDGVIAATIISFAVVELPWESHIVFREFFGRAKAGVYWRSHAVFAAFTVLMCAVAYLATLTVHIDGIGGLALKAMAGGGAATVLLATFKNDVVEIMKKLRR